VEIVPERAGTPPGGDAAPLARFAAQVANPFERKLLADLAAAGVETVDLLPAFLAERARDAAGKAGKQEPLYQAQDTHWTTRGLELAARLVAERVRRYPWYRPLSAQRRAYRMKDASFSRHGDLCSRLPEPEQARYAPESLVGHQVLSADGALYEDDPESPIVLLGDSFTGVYQLMDCEHAGVSAHLASELGLPIDLVMSYGGGPNVRAKLLRRGEDALGAKKVVIWMMTARDLYDFPDGWDH
jgi:alginate O-acetyltransferase complex protein AlgJ